MNLLFDERASDSPIVEFIWQTQSDHAGQFISQATTLWEMVIMTYEGETNVAIRGLETEASQAEYPAGAEFFGISLKLGAYIPHLPLEKLSNRNDLILPMASSKSFWLAGSAWEIPTFDNADVFINRLMRQNMLTIDPVVEMMLNNHPLPLSLRTAQRRFRHATGVTHKTILQIERAKRSWELIKNGVPILDTAYEMGYYDQSHLTNALKRFMGETPAQIPLDRF